MTVTFLSSHRRLELKSDPRETKAWRPWAEGGVVRREGDEIWLVAVLVQVVFRCVRIVSGDGLELKRLAAARPPPVSTTDVVPCDCVLLRGVWVANEVTISEESVPQMKDAVPSEARALDLESDRCHCLFSGSRVVRASDGESIPTDSEIPATPDGGCLCYGLRTGFCSSQGELLQVEFSWESVIGDSKEIMRCSFVKSSCCVGAAAICSHRCMSSVVLPCPCMSSRRRLIDECETSVLQLCTSFDVLPGFLLLFIVLQVWNLLSLPLGLCIQTNCLRDR